MGNVHKIGGQSGRPVTRRSRTGAQLRRHQTLFLHRGVKSRKGGRRNPFLLRLLAAVPGKRRIHDHHITGRIRDGHLSGPFSIGGALQLLRTRVKQAVMMLTPDKFQRSQPDLLPHFAIGHGMDLCPAVSDGRMRAGQH